MTDTPHPEQPPGGVWDELQRAAPAAVTVHGVELRRGSRVRLRPRPGGDVFDLALAGRVGVVEGIDQAMDGAVHLAVTLEDDPGRDLGEGRYPGHRFFFGPEEIEPCEPAAERGGEPPPPRILVAGIGNVFLGDDGFGSAVAQRLSGRTLRDGVRVVDFGIRGMDLAYALQDGWDVAILVDAVPRGVAPGTLCVIEPRLDDDGAVVLDTHGMDPVRVLHLARAMGGVPPRTLVVGCEPQLVPDLERDEEMVMGLSAPVQAAVGEAIPLLESLLDELQTRGAAV